MNFSFVKTSDACPEQYDVLDDLGLIRGYVRLRHGDFVVMCPDVRGAVVYSAVLGADNECGFADEESRGYYLSRALSAIAEYWSTQPEEAWNG